MVKTINVKKIEVKTYTNHQGQTIKSTNETQVLGTVNGVTITAVNEVQTITVAPDVVNHVQTLFPSPADGCIVAATTSTTPAGAHVSHVKPANRTLMTRTMTMQRRRRGGGDDGDDHGGDGGDDGNDDPDRNALVPWTRGRNVKGFLFIWAKTDYDPSRLEVCGNLVGNSLDLDSRRAHCFKCSSRSVYNSIVNNSLYHCSIRYYGTSVLRGDDQGRSGMIMTASLVAGMANLITAMSTRPQ